ncbi:MAG TPA: MarR family transcriptional regulator [Candidatus Saccharimonadales bacterium]|nr:MarR family transcriptional regulator [Candidatus Saccharimonadales bacterium]
MTKNNHNSRYNTNDYSTRTILFHAMVAEKLGLHPTDHKCVVFLLDGRKTMGQLAELTGLTMGAQTASVARLERGGYITRKNDVDDRRKVYIELRAEGLKKMSAYFAPLGEAIQKLETQYTSDELDIIHKYMADTAAILKQETDRLKSS